MYAYDVANLFSWNIQTFVEYSITNKWAWVKFEVCQKTFFHYRIVSPVQHSRSTAVAVKCNTSELKRRLQPFTEFCVLTSVYSMQWASLNVNEFTCSAFPLTIILYIYIIFYPSPVLLCTIQIPVFSFFSLTLTSALPLRSLKSFKLCFSLSEWIVLLQQQLELISQEHRHVRSRLNIFYLYTLLKEIKTFYSHFCTQQDSRKGIKLGMVVFGIKFQKAPKNAACIVCGRT